MCKKKNFSRNNKKSGYDPWFVREISEIINTESLIKQKMSLWDIYLKAKSEGFSDEK